MINLETFSASLYLPYSVEIKGINESKYFIFPVRK